MKLIAARIQNYRSIRDTGWFKIEEFKTILVGPNEAGKTVLLRALQQLNPPPDVQRFDPLRDYPRSQYSEDIQSQKKHPESIPVVSGKFKLEQSDISVIGEAFKGAIYVATRLLNNEFAHQFEGGLPEELYTNKLRTKLRRMAKLIDEAGVIIITDQEKNPISVLDTLNQVIGEWKVNQTVIAGEYAETLRQWLEGIEIDMSDNSEQEELYNDLIQCTYTDHTREKALGELQNRMPVLVYFDSYFRVQPMLHLRSFADRIQQNFFDHTRFDYGNLCLLNFLGFDARELSDLGESKLQSDDQENFEEYRRNLDERDQKLNAASVRLTAAIKEAWRPDAERSESATLRVKADGQYLKVVVEDELGTEVELDQRSAGYQWLVSFFVVFFAETKGKHSNAILLLDEPGLSLHALKQREFRKMISELAKKNQTLYTTHSPFLVGPDELELVRVVEMTKRRIGTIVHQNVAGSDPAAIFALQAALGYDMAQSLFAQQRNLVLEGITDYWYLEATTKLIGEETGKKLNKKIALIPAGGASKVVYFSTILAAHELKVAALFDSDQAGNYAAKQNALVEKLGNKNIILISDVCQDIKTPEIEDLLRDTLVCVAKKELSWDITGFVKESPTRSIISIFKQHIRDEDLKYKLAKKYLHWAKSHSAKDLTNSEREQWCKLIEIVNKALK